MMAAILLEPNDPGAKLAYADALEEQGYVILAFAYRWMARRGKHPHERQSTIKLMRRPARQFAWAWWPELCHDKESKSAPTHAILPRLVLYAADCGALIRGHCFYPSFTTAVTVLAGGLKHLLDELGLPEVLMEGRQ